MVPAPLISNKTSFPYGFNDAILYDICHSKCLFLGYVIYGSN